VGIARLDTEGISTAEAARWLGVRRATLAKWLDEGRIPSYVLGQRLRRVRFEDLEAFLEECRVRPGTLGTR
jgi:excisionase family DNA binding protein